MKVGRKNLWPLEVGHGTKKFENHWFKQSDLKVDFSFEEGEIENLA